MPQHLPTSQRHTFKFWNSYRNFVETATQPPPIDQSTISNYLTDRLFGHAILYGLPAAVLALIPTIFLALRNGRLFLSAFGVSILVVVACVSLNSRLSMSFRKFSAAAALVITGVVLITFLDSCGIGCVYLLTCSIFYALHFSNKPARRSLLVNFAVCAIVALIIIFKIIHTDALAAVKLSDWIAYSVNFLFLNGVIVIMIRQTVIRLERTMQKETAVNQALKNEFAEKQSLLDSLKESENRYKKTLFIKPIGKPDL